MPHQHIPESIDIKPKDVFYQADIIKKSKGKLSREGACNGIVFKYSLEQLERDSSIALIRMKNDILKNFDNFVLMTNIYQEFLQTHHYSNTLETEISETSIRTDNFIESLTENVKKSRVLGFSVMYPQGNGHIIAIIATKDEKGNNFGFRIFDPNFGEINCNNLATYEANRAKFNQQLKNICDVYQVKDKSEAPNQYYVCDLEGFLKSTGLSKRNPYLKDKRLEEDGEQTRVKPILSEYSYDQLNSFLQFHLSKYHQSSPEEKNQMDQDIMELIKFGANPNIIPEPHATNIKFQITNEEFIKTTIIKAMLSKKPDNDQVIQNIANFIGIEALNRIRCDGVTLAFFSFADKRISKSLSLKMLKMGFEFQAEEYKHRGVRMMAALADNPNAALNIGETPIIFPFIKSKEDHKETLDYLLKDPKANINLRDVKGNSLLHIAAKHNKTNIVRSLISKGADIDILNNEGKSIIEISSNPEIIEMLQHAAKPKYSIFSFKAPTPRQPLATSLKQGPKDPLLQDNKENIDRGNSIQTTLNFSTVKPAPTPTVKHNEYKASKMYNPKKRRISEI